MKVNLDMTIEVSDTQRVQIANVLDGKVSKRQATRTEIKDYMWSRGRDWGVELGDEYSKLDGAVGEQLTLEDLL
jgi:hypothetical protein